MILRLVADPLEWNWFTFVTTVVYEVIDFNESTFVILFQLLSWVALKSINLIIDEVKNPLPAIGRSSRPQLVTWKLRYWNTLSYVKELNGFFGPFLLLFIAKQFAMITLFCLSAVSGVSHCELHQVDAFEISHATRNGILLAVVVCASQKITRQVIPRCPLIQSI